MSNQGFVKVCGVTTVADARMVIRAGADVVGLNVWPESPRAVTLAQACAIAETVRGQIIVALVVVDPNVSYLDACFDLIHPDWIQIHGTFPERLSDAWGSRVYGAIGVESKSDVIRAKAALGSFVLVDKKDPLLVGGTGEQPPYALVKEVCVARKTFVAGGLSPDNVAEVITTLAPYGVDAASLLESSPGVKDRRKVERFVKQARSAFGALS